MGQPGRAGIGGPNPLVAVVKFNFIMRFACLKYPKITGADNISETDKRQIRIFECYQRFLENVMKPKAL